ncbi:hypothetical protein BDN70DRAFT_880967 [Pholiota conissans]|uniref:Uncharacterized protein n=1 Tax=Pholiota conissans TaxID=109636 RepID=A0A9P6CYR3_9AGAR|nr:hypothetical protein BDN70DRAFT_880967 [Pholiota conissans]
MAPTFFGKKKKPQDNRETEGIDWADFVIQGASVTLALVKEAADFAPIPGLKQAAGTTLQILSSIQAVKDNKTAFRALGDDATALIAVIWRSYQTSPSKESWPPDDFKVVIDDLVHTLRSINEYVNAMLDRGVGLRWAYSTADVTKINEYRTKLQNAVQRFGVSSDLTIVDIIHQVLKDQKQILEQLAAKGITMEPAGTERISQGLETLKIDDSTVATSSTRSIQANVAGSNQGSFKADIDELHAAAQRRLGKRKENEAHSNLSWRATVETDEETEETEKTADEDWQSASSSENPEPLPKGKKSAPKGKKRQKKSYTPESTPATEIHAASIEATTRDMNGVAENTRASINMNLNASMGNLAALGSMNASMGNIDASIGNTTGHQGHPQSPPMSQFPPSNIPFPYPPFNLYFSHYNPGPSHPYIPYQSPPLPGFPPSSPMAGYGYPNIYGPGVHVNNINSGIVQNSTISNVGNDNSVHNYGGASKPKKRKNRG